MTYQSYYLTTTSNNFALRSAKLVTLAPGLRLNALGMIITIWTIQYFESDTNQALNSQRSSEDSCHVKC